MTARHDDRDSRWRLSDDGVPVALLFIVFAAFACMLPAQSDTFYHLRSGRAMWGSGWFLSQELFSHTAYGRPLPNHWWLSQLVFIGLHEIGGPVLLTVVAGAFAFVAVLLAWRLTSGTMELRLALLAVLALTLPQWSVRPQVFSLLLLMVVVRLVLADRLVWTLPVLILWANMHAVVVLGVAVVGAAAVEALVWSRHRRIRTTAIAAAAALTPMMSPLGADFWAWLDMAVNNSRRLGLHEYLSATATGPEAIPFFVVLAWFLVAVARALPTIGERDRRDRVLVIATAAVAVTALVSQRNIAFFALLAVPTLSRLAPPRPLRRARPATPAGYGLLAAAVIVAGAFVMHRWTDGGTRLGWKPFTPAAIQAIRACPAPIFNGFDDGGALMWFVPEHRVFMDGRIDVYPVDFLLHGRRADLEADYVHLFNRYQIRCAVVRQASPMARALERDASMVKQFENERWTVWVRTTQGT